MNKSASLIDLEMPQSGEKTLETLNRSILVLKAFSRQDCDLSLTDLHKKLGLSKSSLQRILHTLVMNGLLEKDSIKKTYRLGMELYILGKQAEDHPLLQAARPVMKGLADQTGACISLNIAVGEKRKCVAVEAGAKHFSEIVYTGQETPLHAGASGKLLLAYSSPKHIEAYLHDQKEELEALTKDTLTDKGALLMDLWSIREQGYSVSNGERIPGIFCASAPVIHGVQQVAAGISIAVPKLEQDDYKESLLDLIVRAATQVSERLGVE